MFYVMQVFFSFVLYVSGFVTPAPQLVIRSPVPHNVRLYSSVETQTSTHVSVRRSEHNMKGPSYDSLQTDDAKDVNANDIESMLRSHNPSKYIATSKMGNDWENHSKAFFSMYFSQHASFLRFPWH